MIWTKTEMRGHGKAILEICIGIVVILNNEIQMNAIYFNAQN